jgi:Outer membrane protein beta-barrel domain
MHRPILPIVLILSGPMLLASGAASAADNGIYIGGSVGQSNVEIENISGISAADFKGDDTGYKLIAGIRPLDWLAVEASYVNFGKPEDTVAGTKIQAEGDGISAFAVGFLPVGPVDLYLKGGLISWDSKLAGFDENGTDFAYGAGAQFRLLGLSLRAEYEIFDAKDVKDLNMFSVGVTYTFL